MDWTIKPYTLTDPAKLPTRVESALKYLAEAERVVNLFGRNLPVGGLNGTLPRCQARALASARMTR
jgi:hypothetical protein